jgi:hypothetical protein
MTDKKQDAQRLAFEAWYDAQPNGRLEPWDVWQAALASPERPAQQEAVAWIRKHPDGTYSNELLPNWSIERVRRESGAWVPLAPIDAAPPAAQQEPVAKLCLTARQIKAAHAWAVAPAESDDDLDSEWWFGERAKGPWGDDGETVPAGIVMWMAEYPEEGCLPLDAAPPPSGIQPEAESGEWSAQP